MPLAPLQISVSDHYGRNSRVTLMTSARVDSSDQRSPSAPVFRSSVYTTNSSLPGAHSHRSRKFPLTVLLPELYWTSPLTYARGVIVYVTRVRATCWLCC